MALESKAEGRGDALALCQAQCQVQAQPLPLASPPPHTHTSARTSPPSYPRPCAKKYLLQPSVVYILETPSWPPKTFAPLRHRTGSFRCQVPLLPQRPVFGTSLLYPSRELNSATHQTGTRPLSPPIPPHRPLLHNHFRFRDRHTYSHIVDPPPRSPKEKGRGRSKGLGAHRLQRRETHQAAATAPAPAPEPARGRGGVHWERKEPREWEGSQGAGQGTRGRARRHALQARDRPLHSHGLRARHPQGGGARQRIGPPPS